MQPTAILKGVVVVVMPTMEFEFELTTLLINRSESKPEPEPWSESRENRLSHASKVWLLIFTSEINSGFVGSVPLLNNDNSLDKSLSALEKLIQDEKPTQNNIQTNMFAE